MSDRPLIMISAGEASGDQHAAHALQSLTEQGVAWDAFGMGSSRLQALGVDVQVDCRDLAVIGFVDVVLHLPQLLKRLKHLKTQLELCCFISVRRYGLGVPIVCTALVKRSTTWR